MFVVDANIVIAALLKDSKTRQIIVSGKFEEAESIAKKSRLNWKSWKLINAKISKNAAKHAEALLNENNR